jgi:serine/threonine protein kinase
MLPSTDSPSIATRSYYMSPERLQGRKASKESDVWAIALVFLEIVSGHPVNSFLDVPGTWRNLPTVNNCDILGRYCQL